jgi:hypothetical protein
MTVVAHVLKMFNAVCRTHHFYRVWRTTCIYPEALFASPRLTHCSLFPFLLSCSLAYVCVPWLNSFFNFQKERSCEFNVASIRGTCPYLALHNFIFLVKYKFMTFFTVQLALPFFHFALICHNYCAPNFSHILSVCFFPHRFTFTLLKLQMNCNFRHWNTEPFNLPSSSMFQSLAPRICDQYTFLGRNRMA